MTSCSRYDAIKPLTHKYFLSPCKESYEILARSLRICSELKAEILLIQTLPSFNPDERLKGIRDLLSSVDFGSVRLAWEIRGCIAQGTINLMRDIGMIHCTDISKEMPSTDSDILYTRLFGHGEHNLYQFDDVELLDIDTKIERKTREKHISHSTAQRCTKTLLDSRYIKRAEHSRMLQRLKDWNH